jgi:hypothetical protein
MLVVAQRRGKSKHSTNSAVVCAGSPAHALLTPTVVKHLSSCYRGSCYNTISNPALTAALALHKVLSSCALAAWLPWNAVRSANIPFHTVDASRVAAAAAAAAALQRSFVQHLNVLLFCTAQWPCTVGSKVVRSHSAEKRTTRTLNTQRAPST